MQIRVIFAAVAAVAILAGCAAGNDRLRNLNSQQIAEQIVDTQTNRQDVVALLGEPNTTQQEADGTKVLEYTWVRSRPSAKNFIPLNPIDEFPTTKKSLRVWIDDNDRVVKHEYSGVFLCLPQAADRFELHAQHAPAHSGRARRSCGSDGRSCR